MNIPKREGHYTLNLKQYTLDIHIETVFERMNKTDVISMGRRNNIGGYKPVKRYKVDVLDKDGNIIDQTTTWREMDYISFVSSYIGKESELLSNPKDVMDDIYMKIQIGLDTWVKKADFNGIVKNRMKMTFYINDWGSGDKIESDTLSDFFEKLGIMSKINPKKKNIGAGTYWIVTLYVPLDFNTNNINETINMNKKLIKLTESDLHRIVKETVKRVLNESTKDRYVLVYDGEEDYNSFSTSNLNAAINAAIQDYEEGGHSTIEILDSLSGRID